MTRVLQARTSQAGVSQAGVSQAGPPFGEGEIRSLTGLRGCAACLVMLYHFSFNMPAGSVPMQVFLRNGYLWVDLFFVLSGFVMAYSQARMFAGGYRLRAHGVFLVARIVRIYPLYAVVTIESACLVAWRMAHLELYPFARTLLLNLAMIQAWGLAPSFEGAAWSISTEWGAYIVFPLLLVAAVSSSRRVACTTTVAAMLAVGYIALSPGPFAFPDQSRNGPLDVYSPATIAPLIRCVAEFSLGLVAFRLARHLATPSGDTRHGSGSQPWAGPLAVVTLALIVAALSQSGLDVWVVALFGVLLVSLAPQSGARRMGILARFLGAPVPYRLGQWSYSIYLIHDKFSRPAGLLQDRLAGHVPMAPVVAMLLTSVAVIGCGAMTFFLIERPLRKLLLRRLQRSPVTAIKPTLVSPALVAQTLTPQAIVTQALGSQAGGGGTLGSHEALG